MDIKLDKDNILKETEVFKVAKPLVIIVVVFKDVFKETIQAIISWVIHFIDSFNFNLPCFFQLSLFFLYLIDY